MVYPNVTTEEWLLKYPGLRKRQALCNYCNVVLEANVPYISKNYIGLTSTTCKCGHSRTKVDSAFPRTYDIQQAWDEALGECYE